MVLELVWGADFWCNRQCRTTPVVLDGFLGEVWPKIVRKLEKSEHRNANEPLSRGYYADTQASGPQEAKVAPTAVGESPNRSQPRVRDPGSPARA